MSVRHLLPATAAAVFAGFWLAAPASANVLLAEGDGGSGRGPSAVALVFALISVVLGALSLRAASRGGAANVRVRAIVGLALGLVGLIVGVVALAGADGGVGSGSGRGGSVVAVVLALIGVGLGALVVARSRRAVA
ncbi:DUF6223 family protein [Streptomyces sp. NPDC099050]|uniref:DUF6223 family protein n=1 Tax=Streptomyces sp. NPDC099050 TaxID=3366100 RepID=UPI0037F8B2A6